MSVFLAHREKAEQAIWNRLRHLRALKARRQQQAGSPLRIGILGTCAARGSTQCVPLPLAVPLPLVLCFLLPSGSTKPLLQGENSEQRDAEV